MRIGRGVLAGSLGGAVVVAGLLLSGAAAGPLSPTALTPTERNALRIVSLRAVGAEGGGLVVTVTFAGNLEKTIGRGNLKHALVAMILRPKDPQFATADLATEGAGRLGVTSKKTRSSAVGIVRDGRTLTFFVSGPGSSDVGSVVVKAFASAPGRKPARTTAGTRVSPEQWEQIENAIATQEKRTELLDAFASGRPGEDCIVLRHLYEDVLRNLARARLRADDLKQLGKQIDAAIAQAEKKVGLKVAFAAAAAHTIASPIGIGLTVLWGQSPVHQAQTWKDLLRNLKLDRRLADALAEKNQQLINSLLELKGRLEGLHKARCSGTGTTTPPATFNVGLDTSYTHGGSTSTFCVVVTTTPPKPGASAKVHVSGPGVVGPADQTKTLDAAGKAVANVTINTYGEYTATADVTAGTETVSGTGSKEVKREPATCPPP